MTTFLSVVLLLLTGLVIVVAQLKPPCMRGKKLCVSDAVCNNNPKRCRCPPNTRGNPLFDCAPKGNPVCLVIKDPTLKQFPRSRGKLFLPCRHHLSQYNTQLIGAKHACEINVFGTSELQESGSYFENEMELCFKVGNDGLYFRINKDGVSRTTDENGFGANGDQWITTPLDQPLDLDLNGFDVNVFMDSDKIVNVEFCSSIFKFRPSTPGQDPQKRVPGISVTLLIPELTHFPKNTTLCSTTQNEKKDLKKAAKALGLTVNEYLLYLSLKFAPPQNRGEFKVECFLTCNVFKKNCDEKDQLKAVKKCMPLLSNRRFVKCVESFPFLESPMDYFLDCVKFFCTGDWFACTALRDLNSKCKLPKKLQNLNCGPEPSAFNANP